VNDSEWEKNPMKLEGKFTSKTFSYIVMELSICKNLSSIKSFKLII